MSVHVVSWVLRNSEARGAERLVLLSVADHAGPDGTGAFPAVKRIAKDARVSERTARYSLRALEAAGRVIYEGEGPAGTRRYAVRMDRESETEGGQTLPGADLAGGAKYDHQGRGGSAPEPTTEPSEGTTTTSFPSSFDLEVDRLCELFSTLTRARTETPASSSRYRVSVRWRIEMDRLLRIDGRSPLEVEQAIRWLDRDEFWSGVVLSVPKLRAKFDQLRATAKRKRPADRLGIDRMREWAERADAQADAA